ncbi:MAG: SOS response-associated peptidase family protein [Hormoscilla sp. GM7CHS1pb]|nr:SOS response-associated peptidase family protein [Hormoscilla sp. GM7CHS1pb]
MTTAANEQVGHIHQRMPVILSPAAYSQWQAVRIEISDTGVGIDKQDQQAIFDLFFRVENRVHTLEGTGLGLSIVRNIMEKHHTRIELVSEVGVGTTFWFDLAIYREKEVSVEDVIRGRESYLSEVS